MRKSIRITLVPNPSKLAFPLVAVIFSASCQTVSAPTPYLLTDDARAVYARVYAFELPLHTAEEYQQHIRDNFDWLDADDNGLSTDDYEYTNFMENNLRISNIHLINEYLRLDANRDGQVTIEEIEATSSTYLQEQTLAGVGPRTAETIAKPGRSLTMEDAVRCRYPSPSSDAQIIRLGAREGAQLSSVAVGGQNEATYAVSVEIEPGDTPLFIVATSKHAQLWRFSGATHRVQAFIGSSFERDARSMWPAVGVTGLPEDKFYTVPHACFGDVDESTMRSDPQTSDASRLLNRRLGRNADVMFGAFKPHGIRIPSAQTFSPPPEVPTMFRSLQNETALREWRGFLGHFPGGITEPTVDSIIAPSMPQRFEVYSYRAGIAQLVETGALTPIPDSPLQFDITRQIRFPAGLYGGFLLNFRLARGVPLPTGNRGHSKVWSSGTPPRCLIGCRQGLTSP